MKSNNQNTRKDLKELQTMIEIILEEATESLIRLAGYERASEVFETKFNELLSTDADREVTQ